MKSLVQIAREAEAAHIDEAKAAFAAYVAHCGGKAPHRVPGMATITRLAIRVYNGRTIEEAAAREYVYRWHLALKSRTFGVPHCLGM